MWAALRREVRVGERVRQSTKSTASLTRHAIFVREARRAGVGQLLVRSRCSTRLSSAVSLAMLL